MYRKVMGRKLNLDNPQTFNEKINYLKLFVYPNNKKVINCTDKLMVREYLKEKKLDKYLIPLINSYENANDINFEKLPQKFVLKCNHGCAYNILCRNKELLDINKTRKQLNKWLKEDYGNVSSELHYNKIKPMIICEEFLEDDIKDYKFFCFKGKVKFLYVSQNINGDFHDMRVNFFYPDGSLADFTRTDHKCFDKIPKLPNELDEMTKVAEKLSEDFEFVRVDLYNVNGKIYFSELTFTPCAGFMELDPHSADEKYGKLIDLKRCK